jgi:hypothetical protein
MNTDLKTLALDIYKNKVKTFTKEDGTVIDANDALRQLFDAKTGGDRSYRAFNKIKDEFFEILEVLITEGTSTISREVFKDIMVFKDTAYGEKPEFIAETPELFDVSVVAASNDNIRRERVFNNHIPTVAFDLGLKTYTEYDAFMLGRIDLNALIDKVIASFNKRVAEKIGEVFSKAYDNISVAELKVTHTTVDEAKLLELCEKVGEGAVIYGSKLALSKIPSIAAYAVDSDDVRNVGYVRQFKGVKCVELENVYNKDTKSFAIANDTLFVIPNGDKIIYGGFEGDAYVIDNLDNPTARLDRQLELTYVRRLHLGIGVTNRYGAYKIA